MAMNASLVLVFLILCVAACALASEDKDVTKYENTTPIPAVPASGDEGTELASTSEVRMFSPRSAVPRRRNASHIVGMK